MKRGFTMVELLIVAAIAVFITTIIVSGYSRFLDAQRLNSAVEETVSLLQKARNQTLSSENSLYYGVYFDTSSNPHRIMRYKSIRYDDLSKRFDNPGDDLYNFPGSVEITSLSLVDSATEPCATDPKWGLPGPLKDEGLVFQRISGDALVHCGDPGTSVGTTTLSSGTIVITSVSSGVSRTITILPTGVIEVQ